MCAAPQAGRTRPQTYLVHVGAGLGGRLHIADAPLLGARLGLVRAHLPPVVQVRFVAHQEEGHVLILLHSQDLLPRKQQTSPNGTASHKVSSGWKGT